VKREGGRGMVKGRQGSALNNPKSRGSRRGRLGAGKMRLQTGVFSSVKGGGRERRDRDNVPWAKVECTTVKSAEEGKFIQKVT